MVVVEYQDVPLTARLELVEEDGQRDIDWLQTRRAKRLQCVRPNAELGKRRQRVRPEAVRLVVGRVQRHPSDPDVARRDHAPNVPAASSSPNLQARPPWSAESRRCAAAAGATVIGSPRPDAMAEGRTWPPSTAGRIASRSCPPRSPATSAPAHGLPPTLVLRRERLGGFTRVVPPQGGPSTTRVRRIVTRVMLHFRLRISGPLPADAASCCPPLAGSTRSAAACRTAITGGWSTSPSCERCWGCCGTPAASSATSTSKKRPDRSPTKEHGDDIHPMAHDRPGSRNGHDRREPGPRRHSLAGGAGAAP